MDRFCSVLWTMAYSQSYANYNSTVQTGTRRNRPCPSYIGPVACVVTQVTRPTNGHCKRTPAGSPQAYCVYDTGGRHGTRSAVQAVVDVVNNVLGLRLEEDEARLVLLHCRRLGCGEARLGVHLSRVLKRRLRDHLARRVGVHARQLGIDADPM